MPPGVVDDPDTLLPPISEKSTTYRIWKNSGRSNWEDLLPGFLPLTRARDGFLEANAAGDVAFLPLRAATGIAGAGTAIVQSWPPEEVPSGDPVLPGENPAVGHTELTGVGRVFAEVDVWRFFRTHPRVGLL